MFTIHRAHLEGQPLQDGVFLNCLDVVNSKTDKQVHDDDGHDYYKCNKEEACGQIIGDLWRRITVALVMALLCI